MIPVDELTRLMNRLGETMKKWEITEKHRKLIIFISRSELEEMMSEADRNKDGMVDYQGEIFFLCVSCILH